MAQNDSMSEYLYGRIKAVAEAQQMAASWAEELESRKAKLFDALRHHRGPKIEQPILMTIDRASDVEIRVVTGLVCVRYSVTPGALNFDVTPIGTNIIEGPKKS